MKRVAFILAFLLTLSHVRSQTVVDIIVNSPDHTILEAAVLAAGLEGTLSGPGPFTVFAPTDAAFGALPAGTIEALLADPQGALTDILLYHVVGATALSTDLSDGQVIATLNGDDVTVTINGQGVFINNAQVIVADLIADNGVVHVIDAVLLPLTSATAATEYTDGLVFPNPTSSAITIRLDASVPAMHNVQMIDVDGRIIDGWRMINNGETINIRDVPSGMYTLFFEINATPYFQRIVVQK